MTLPCLYLPPISWFAKVKNHPTVSLEVYENFQKQTERNRCHIDSPGGRLTLSIPIDRRNFSDKGKCLMKDVRISRQLDWRHQHWQAFETTYYNSPFFEYLQDDFRPIYGREWTYLADLNEALILKCLELLELDVKTERTTEFKGTSDYSKPFVNGAKTSVETDRNPCQKGCETTVETRFQLLPTAPRNQYTPPYYQVFAHKHGFLNDLSVIDLLFNMGPEAPLYI